MYGSEVLLTAAQNKIDAIERLQNRALRIITGAVKTAPIASMQLYTNNLPVFEEIKKQAMSTYIRLKSSQKAKWIEEGNTEILVTQISPIAKCREMMREIDKDDSIDCLKNLVSPLEYVSINHHLTLDGLTKKDNPDALLKASAISLMEENYPEPHWTRVFTDGSQMNETTGAGVYSKLFSLWAPVGNCMNNFDAEIYAIHLALKNLILRINNDSFPRVVIFVDSSAAIQAISNNHHSETQIITQIKKDINLLKDLNIQIVFQWIPSHVGIHGNEEADILAKRGNQETCDETLTPPDSLKKYVHRNIENTSRDNLINKSKDKKWQNIHNTWKKYSLKPRKEAVAHFRLATGHDCMAEHLNRIGVMDSSSCTICNSGIMNSDHPLNCVNLNRAAQEQRDLATLYWTARDLMDDK